MGLLFTMLALAIGTACDERLLSPGTDEPVRVVGIVEVTISGIGSGQPGAFALSAPDVASLARVRAGASYAAGRGLTAAAPPANLDLSGDGTIQLEPVATGSFTNGIRGVDGERYLYATFRVRNAQSDGTVYDTPRQNLTFLAAATGSTLESTAVSVLQRFDGSAAGPGIASAIMPTGSVVRNVDGDIEPVGADVLQVVTEAEAAALTGPLPPGVTSVFPWGFMVRNPSTPANRTLADSPAPAQFDGLVTFAFRVPLQTAAADDPYTISAVFVAVDDPETRITESLEEQGTSVAQSGAIALSGVTSVTLLGSSATVITEGGVRRICRVRTAGTDPLAPDATLVDEGAPCAPGAVSFPDNVIVVDDDALPGGDGSSWNDAFEYLQDALACVRDDAGSAGACEGIDEIWVAGGSYYPDEGTGVVDNSTASRFEPIEGVSLYGGFTGSEYSRAQRDWTVNVTALEGDIDQDGSISGNATSIIYVDATGGAGITPATVVDGFTIRDALQSAAIRCFADGVGSECSPTLRNLIVTANNTSGMRLRASNGAVASPLLEDVAFNGNRSAFSGGALLIEVITAPSVASPVLVRTMFDGNASTGSTGGAIAMTGSAGTTADVRLYSASFRSNTAATAGGAVYVNGGTVRFMNAEFWNNQAGGDGGAVASVDLNDSITLSGATLAANVAGSDGGAIYQASGTMTISNTIIWGNSPDQVVTSGTGSAAFSVIQGGCPAGIATCTSIIDADPLFNSLVTGDLRVDGISPAVDSGSNGLLPVDEHDLDGDGNTAELLPLDLAGRLRLFDWGGDASAVVDMGAYERQ